MRRCTLCGAAALLAACATGEQPRADTTDAVVQSPDGVPIHYEAHGTGELALILIHGWTNSRGIFGEHLHTLADRYRVVSLDLAGHGDSGERRRDWTMEAFGEDVRAVADAQQLRRVVLVGFSMGGIVALEAARLMEDRVAGVVLVDTFHDPEFVIPQDAFEGMMQGVRTGWGDTAFIRAFAYTPDAPDSLVRRTTASMPATPREHWFAVARRMRAWTEHRRPAVLAQLAVPVAAINTTNPPTAVDAWRRYVPAFTVDTMQGVGHAGILHQRVADFDSRLDALVRRFAAGAPR
jgi:pimeloyl-ACP methyl ester carboxylesterase